MRRLRKNALPLAAALALLALAAVAASLALARGGNEKPQAHARATAQRQTASRDLVARFAVLSRAHSNRCGMPASALNAMPPGSRLQGSCCFPMDYRSYVNQVRELSRRYPSVDVVPKDPYDIPVSLAKRLISYQSITLTPEQQKTYKRAVPLSSTKGPCCCPCWRWTAFGGQAKYLIARRHYSAKQIAEVWSLEEGCGGPSHSHA